MSTLDSAAGSVAAAQEAAVMNQVMYAVAKKASDTNKQQGEAVVQLIDSAAALGKAIGAGKNFDAVG